MLVEVMGRYAGWIALNVGVSGTADAILIPEIPYDLQKVAEKVAERESRGQKYAIVVVAEGAAPKGGTLSVVGKDVGSPERLGGIGEKVSRELGELTGKDTRLVVVGHLLRGGSPTTFDRADLPSLRSGCSARVGGGSVGRHGGFRSANRPLRPIRRGHPRHEGGFLWIRTLS